MRKIKATPVGLAFTESSDPTAARLSDVGYYAIRIEPVADMRGLVIDGDIAYMRSVDARGNDYAAAMFGLTCRPKLGGKTCRYYIDEDKRYAYAYTRASINEFLSELTGEPCEIEIVGEGE